MAWLIIKSFYFQKRPRVNDRILMSPLIVRLCRIGALCALHALREPCSLPLPCALVTQQPSLSALDVLGVLLPVSLLLSFCRTVPCPSPILANFFFFSILCTDVFPDYIGFVALWNHVITVCGFICIQVVLGSVVILCETSRYMKGSFRFILAYYSVSSILHNAWHLDCNKYSLHECIHTSTAISCKFRM